MQGRSHAQRGARTIGARRHVPAWSDAFSSIQLVGTSTVSDRQGDGTALEGLIGHGDPISAARTWIDHRRDTLPVGLASCAEATLEVADEHFRSMDSLAERLASDARLEGFVDPNRLAQVETLAAALGAYASTLRELLDVDHSDPIEAERRLTAALQVATTSGGGLPALVAALAP